MKIECGISKNRDAVAVIPTMDVNQPRVQSLVEELDLGGADSLLVEDRLPEFRFATSMNRGIQRALEQENIKCIILSNDDVHDIQGLPEMIVAAVKGHCYIQPLINGSPRRLIMTTSRVRFILNYAIMRRAPFYAFRIVQSIRRISPETGFIMSAPALPLDFHVMQSVQPFSVFDAEILRHCVFDEKFRNGIEDDDLAFRLRLAGVKGKTGKGWRVSHQFSTSFREASHGKKSILGLYYSTDDEMVENITYLSKKYRS